MQQSVSNNVASAIIPVRDAHVASRPAARKGQRRPDPAAAREDTRPESEQPRAARKRTDDGRPIADQPRKTPRKRPDGTDAPHAPGQQVEARDKTDFQAVLAEKLSGAGETPQGVQGNAPPYVAVDGLIQAAAQITAAPEPAAAPTGETRAAEVIAVPAEPADAMPETAEGLAIESTAVAETTPAAVQVQQIAVTDAVATTAEPPAQRVDGVPLPQELTVAEPQATPLEQPVAAPAPAQVGATQETTGASQPLADNTNPTAAAQIRQADSEPAGATDPAAEATAQAVSADRADTIAASGDVVRQTVSRRAAAQGVRDATDAPTGPPVVPGRPPESSPIHAEPSARAAAAALRAGRDASTEAQITRSHPAEAQTRGGAATEGDRPLQSVLGGTAPVTAESAGVVGLAGRSAATGPTHDLHRPQQMMEDVPVVGQLTQALRAQGPQAGQQILVRLDPPELGQVRMILQDDGGSLRGIVEVSNPRTYAELQQEMPALAQRLAESGIDVRRIEVVLSDQGRGNLADADGSAGLQQNHQGRQHGDQGAAAGRSPGEIGEAEGGGGPATRGPNDYVGEASINVWI